MCTKRKQVEGFTKKYKVTKLVYYELFRDVKNAIFREKQIKGGSRAKKLELINGMNAGWKAGMVCGCVWVGRLAVWVQSPGLPRLMLGVRWREC